MWTPDTRVQFEIQLPDYITPFRVNLLCLSSWNKARQRFLTSPALIPQLEEDIFRVCLVEPKWYLNQIDNSKAFTVTTLVNIIMMLSGTPDDPEVANYQLNVERSQIDVTKQMLVSICRAFPSMSPELVETMSWGSLCKYYALAEHLLLQINGLQSPLEFTPPEEVAPKDARVRRLATQPGESQVTRDSVINFEAEAIKLGKDMGFSAHDEPEIQQQKQSMLEYAQRIVAEREGR